MVTCSKNMKHCLDRENGCNPYGDSCSCGCNICLKIPEPKYSEHFASYAQGERETITKVRKWIDDIKNNGKIAYHNELDLLIEKLDSEIKQ